MKRTFILSSIAVFTAAILLSSCGPSRVYSNNRNAPPPPPPSRSYMTLIISPTPGFVMNRTNDGRYYHRSRQGFVYWKGYDDRFYLDRNDLRRVSYSKWEYNQWKRYSRSQPQHRNGRRY